MNCRTCDKELAAGEEKMVAQWAFCEKCFQDLLNKKNVKEEPETPAEAPAEKAAKESTEEPAEAAPELCHLCRKTLVEGERKKVGIWNFCTDCVSDLNKPAGRVNVSTSVQTEEEPEQEEIVVLKTTYINCADCGRRVPERGSKEREGERYCPDCYFRNEPPPQALNAMAAPPAAKTEEISEPAPEEAPEPEEEPKVAVAVRASVSACIPPPQSAEVTEESAPAVEVAPAPEAPAPEPPAPSTQKPAEPLPAAAGKCMSCLNEGCELKEVQGFNLCSACLVSDKNLAIDIAKKRHKKMMEKLSQELD